MKKILIVDDDKDLLYSLTSLFSGKGYKTLTIESGTSVLSLAKIFHPDMILLDIKLPDTDGRSVCRKLKDDPGTKMVPIIVTSAVINRTEIKECDASRFLEKPFDFKTLFSTVESVI